MPRALAESAGGDHGSLVISYLMPIVNAEVIAPCAGLLGEGLPRVVRPGQIRMQTEARQLRERRRDDVLKKEGVLGNAAGEVDLL